MNCFPSVGPDGFASMLARLGKGACSPLIQYFGWLELRLDSSLTEYFFIPSGPYFCFYIEKLLLLFFLFFYLYVVSPISLLPEKPLFLFSFLLPFNFS